MFAMSCWKDAFVCVACSLIVAVLCAERFAMCKWIVPAIVSAMSLSESLFVARPAKRLFWAYPPCMEVIVPDMRHRCLVFILCGTVISGTVAKFIFQVFNIST